MTHQPPELFHLFDNLPPHPFHRLFLLEPKVEQSRARRFVGRFVPHREVRVHERVLARDALVRVEREQFREQVERERVRSREQLHERDSRLVRERADVVLRARGTDPSQSVVRGGAEEVQDNVELVDVVLTLEDGPAAEQLGEHATDRPDVDCERGSET